MWVPADPDTLLDDPAVRARNVAEDYMPYWAWVWPSSPPMAELVRRAGWLRGTEALELGSGLGMVGVAAGLAGLQVTFTGTPGGGTGSYAHAWDFGDGASSTQQSPVHTYAAPGTYSVTYVVTDTQSGCQTQYNEDVTP